MTTRHLFQSLLLMLFLMLSGCNQSNTSESSTQRDTNFTIELDSKKLHAFTHTPIKVYTDNLSEEITPDVRIKSHDMSIAYYENGEIHTQNPGDTTLTLSYLEREQNLSLHVKENKPLYIQASSNKYSLHSKLSALLSCNAFFDDNISQDITPNVLWSVAPKEYAYIDTNQSYLYALKEGNITITASYQGLSSSFNAIVLNANIEALSLSDTSISLHNNTSHQLQATLHYDDGLKENATTDVTWKSITPQVVSVSHEGMLQAHQRGSSHIEATYNDFTQSIPVEVLHNKINSMLISNQHDALYLFHFDGHSISQSGCFELLARYDDGLTQMIEHDALWQSSHLDILSFGDKNCYQTKGHGDVTVTASKDGVTSTFKTKVTSKELIDLELHTPLSILDKGMRTTLNSYGIDIHGDQYNLAQETFWYSNNQAIASVFNDVYAGELFARNTGDVRIQTQLASMQRSIDLKIDTAALVSLEIIPDINESLPQGYEKNLKVYGYYADGSKQEITSLVTWKSSHLHIAEVDETGLLKALNVGDTTISASLGSVYDTLVLQVIAPEVVAIIVEAPLIEIKRSEEMRMKAFGVYSNGVKRDFTDVVTWSSNPSYVATVANGGYFYAANIGYVNVTASYEELSDSIQVTVIEPDILSIKVILEANRVDINQSTQAQAIVIYSDKRRDDITTKATWTSLYPTIASIDDSGKITGIKVGDATIRAYYKGFFAEDIIEVYASAQALVIDAPSSQMDINTSMQLIAFEYYSDGSRSDVTNKTQWSSTDPLTASVDQNGLLEALNVGETTIIASLGSVNDTLELQVTAPEVVAIIVEAPQVQIKRSEEMRMKAFGIYNNGVKKDFTDVVTWSSYPSYVATVSADGYLYAANIGNVNVTASYGELSDSVQVTVLEPDILSIEVIFEANEVDINQNVQAQAIAIYSDNRRDDITTKATWTSLYPTIASIDDSGKITGIKVGDATIRAYYKGFFVEDIIKVYASSQALVIDAPSSQMDINTSMQLTAFEYYSDGSRSDVTNKTQWSSTDPLKASVDQNGNVTALTTGLVQITAEYNALNAQHDITVTSP